MSQQESRKSGKKKKKVRTASKAEIEEGVGEEDKNEETKMPTERRKSTPGWSDNTPAEGKKSTMSRRVSMAVGATRDSFSSNVSNPSSVLGEGGQSRKSVVGMSKIDTSRRATKTREVSTGSLWSTRENVPEIKTSFLIQPKGTLSLPATNLEKSKVLRKIDKDVEANQEPPVISKRECWKPVRSGRNSNILFSGCNYPVVIDSVDRENVGCRERTLESARHFCRDKEKRTNIYYGSYQSPQSRSEAMGASSERSYSTRNDIPSIQCTSEIRPSGVRDFDESGNDFRVGASSDAARKNYSQNEDLGNKSGKENRNSQNLTTRESRKASIIDDNSALRKGSKGDEQNDTAITKTSDNVAKPTGEDKSDLSEQVSSQKDDSKKNETEEIRDDSNPAKESKRNS